MAWPYDTKQPASLETLQKAVDQILALLKPVSDAAPPAISVSKPLARDVITATDYADQGLAIDGHVVREGVSLSNMTTFLASPLPSNYKGSDVDLVHIGFTNEGDLTPAEEAESAASGGGWSGIPQRAQAWREKMRNGLTAEAWLTERLRQIDSTSGTPGAGPSGGT